MNCIIEYVGKKRNGTCMYWCSTHKFIASDNHGNKLDNCLCSEKELYDNVIDINKENVRSIRLTYDVLKDAIPKIYINNKEFNGVLKSGDSILTYKDIFGTMLSKLNNIDLAIVKCSHCGHYHSDNGRFSYTKHRTHLCTYCGHLFRVKEANIGNEFTKLLNVPNIKLNDNKIDVDNKCFIDYDLLNGTLKINNSNIDKIIFKNKERSLIDFLNKKLEDKF